MNLRFLGFFFTVFLVLQVGHIYHWSIVYYIVCRYSPKTNVDESTVNKETNPENPPKCSTRALAPAVNKSLPSDCIDQLEVECKVPDGQEKVVVFSKGFCIADLLPPPTSYISKRC